MALPSPNTPCLAYKKSNTYVRIQQDPSSFKEYMYVVLQCGSDRYFKPYFYCESDRVIIDFPNPKRHSNAFPRGKRKINMYIDAQQ